MEESEQSHITKHLPSLIEKTNCTCILLAILKAENILAEEDVEDVNASGTQLKKASLLYSLIPKRKNSFKIMKLALQKTKQSGAYDILNSYNTGGRSKLKSHGLITYDINILLGKGSNLTKVYQGTFDDRNAAVKVINIEITDVNKCLQEIDILKKIDCHQNVIRLFHAEITDSLVLVALELCCMNLKTFVATKCELLSSESIIRQMTDGLVHLHQSNVLHGDLKPENILLCSRPNNDVEIKISDFGLSREIQAGLSQVTFTAQGLGTAGWMPKEVINYASEIEAQGDSEKFDLKKFSKSIDIFSLGCIFFYVLSNGLHPFGERTLRMANIVQNKREGFKKAAIQNVGNRKDFWYSLIREMISEECTKRPSVEQVQQKLLDLGMSRRQKRKVSKTGSLGVERVKKRHDAPSTSGAPLASNTTVDFTTEVRVINTEALQVKPPSKADISKLTGLPVTFEELMSFLNQTKCGSANAHFKHKWVRQTLEAITETNETLMHHASQYLTQTRIKFSAELFDQLESRNVEAEQIVILLLKSGQNLRKLISVFEEDVDKDRRYMHPPKGIDSFLRNDKTILTVNVIHTSLTFCSEWIMTTVCGIQKYDNEAILNQLKPLLVAGAGDTLNIIKKTGASKYIIITEISEQDVQDKEDLTYDNLDWKHLSQKFKEYLLKCTSFAGVPTDAYEKESYFEILSSRELVKAISLEFISLEALESSLKEGLKEISKAQREMLEDVSLHSLNADKGKSKLGKIDQNPKLWFRLSKASPPNFNSVEFIRDIFGYYLSARAIIRKHDQNTEFVLETQTRNSGRVVNGRVEWFVDRDQFKHKLVAIFLDTLLEENNDSNYTSRMRSTHWPACFVEACCYVKASNLLQFVKYCTILSCDRPLLHLLCSHTDKLTNGKITSIKAAISQLMDSNVDFLKSTIFGEKFTPLMMPFVHVDIIKHLIDLGANVSATSAPNKQNFAHLLTLTYNFRLSSEQFAELVNYLIIRGLAKQVFNARDIRQQTPLLGMLRYAQYDISCIEKLYSAGVDFSAVDEDGNGVMLNAALGGESSVVLETLASKCGASWTETNLKNKNLLHCAVLGGNIQTITFLLQHKSPWFGVNGKDADGCNPLLLVAKQGTWRTHDVVKLQISKNDDATATDNEGRSVTYHAKRNPNIEMRTLSLIHTTANTKGSGGGGGALHLQASLSGA